MRSILARSLRREESGRTSVSPQYDLQGKRLVPANQPSRGPARTLAGATILQIVPNLSDSPAGNAAIDIAQTLVQAGARALVASDGGPLGGALRAFGGEWLPMTTDLRNPLKLRKNARILRDMIQGERIDIVHAQSAGAAWSAMSAADRMPVYLVTSFPDRLAPSSWFGNQFEAALARGDRVIAPSAYIAQAMIARYKIPQSRITVIPRRVDTAAFSPAVVHPDRIAALRRSWGVLPNQRVVLVPGRIAPWNGQMGIADAARLLVGNGQRSIVFILAGDDRSERNYARAVLRRAHVHGIDTLFRIVGATTDMPTAIAASDVVVLPALKPPLSGRTAAEAQAMGRPVVVNAVGVLPENILAPPRMPDHLRTGWVARPGDAGELARGIASALILNPAAYDALGARARQYAEFMFSPQSVAVAIRGVYTSLLSRA
ncbi:MAG: glycosyltransferase [Pseudolabrys sp.]|nr:glycosyltransferase [Pseudolabrys sp.]